MFSRLKIMLGMKPNVIWESDKLPYIEGYANMNHSKCVHKRRILDMLLKGRKMSAMEYADEFKTTKFGTRISELRNEYGFNIQDYWQKSENCRGFKKYYIEKDNVA